MTEPRPTPYPCTGALSRAVWPVSCWRGGHHHRAVGQTSCRQRALLVMPRAANNGTLEEKGKIGKKKFGLRGEDYVFVIKG